MLQFDDDEDEELERPRRRRSLLDLPPAGVRTAPRKPNCQTCGKAFGPDLTRDWFDERVCHGCAK